MVKSASRSSSFALGARRITDAEAPQHRERRYDRICLTGFMGSGKSTCGKLLAQRLNWRFTDLDHAITQEQRLSIAQIFERVGESGFREMERKVLLEALRQPHTVTALGGGTWIDPASREAIREKAVTIWLDAPVEHLWQRSAEGPERPLRGNEEEFVLLLKSRRPQYAEADVRVETQDKATKAVVEEIFDLLSRGQWLEE